MADGQHPTTNAGPQGAATVDKASNIDKEPIQSPAAKGTIGVYERPERSPTLNSRFAMIIAVLVILALIVFLIIRLQF